MDEDLRLTDVEELVLLAVSRLGGDAYGLLIRLARAARRSSGVGLVVVGGAATVIVVASLHSVTEMVFEGNMPAFLIWLIMGLASTLAPTTRLFGNASPEDRLDPVVGGRDNFASPRSTGGAE